MAKVTLTLKDGNTTTSEQFVIERIRLGQFMALKREVGGALKDLKGNGDIKRLFETALGDDGILNEEMNDDEQVQALEALKDERFINGLASAFDILIETVPERAYNMIAILSDIPAEKLEQAYLEEILDVYDAIMSENDVATLAERVQKSFFNTKGQWGEMGRRLFGNPKKASASQSALRSTN